MIYLSDYSPSKKYDDSGKANFQRTFEDEGNTIRRNFTPTTTLGMVGAGGLGLRYGLPALKYRASKYIAQQPIRIGKTADSIDIAQIKLKNQVKALANIKKGGARGALQRDIQRIKNAPQTLKRKATTFLTSPKYKMARRLGLGGAALTAGAGLLGYKKAKEYYYI